MHASIQLSVDQSADYFSKPKLSFWITSGHRQQDVVFTPSLRAGEGTGLGSPVGTIKRL